jgi:hypothetical protein
MDPDQTSGARRSDRIGPLAVCLISLAGYVVTADQRGHYCDDFALRAQVVEHGWFGAYLDRWQEVGPIRPLGHLHIFAWHLWLWDSPAVAHVLAALWHVAVCLLLYRVVVELVRDARIGLAAAAIFAAWPSYTNVVCWTSTAASTLPTMAAFLGSLGFYVRYLCAEPRRSARRWWTLSLIGFGMSLLIYDQHLGSAAVFSALAVLMPRSGGRLRTLIGTLPFWACSAGVAIAYTAMSVGSDRPLHPSLSNVASSLGGTIMIFLDKAVSPGMADRWLGRWGAPGEMIARDPYRLVLTLAGVLAGSLLTVVALRSASTAPCARIDAVRLATAGGVLALVTLAILAARSPEPTIQARHTLIPAIAAGFGLVRGARRRSVAVFAVTASVVALSVLRLGHVYEWTLRTRVTNGILDSVADLPRTPQPGELLVIDGVFDYGRGFQDSWGLSGAVSLAQGIRACWACSNPVRVATTIRAEDGRLFANEAWDVAWEVDLAATRFFRWDPSRHRLEPSSLPDHLSRHREIHWRPSTRDVQDDYADNEIRARERLKRVNTELTTDTKEHQPVEQQQEDNQHRRDPHTPSQPQQPEHAQYDQFALERKHRDTVGQ